MSDELRLPDDLAACEAWLAARVLPASGINRDELMYRAGWAAGAETARLATPRLKAVAWSLTSAAAAASIAVMLTHQWRPNETPNVAVDPAGSRPPLAAHEGEPRPSERPRVALARASTPSLNIGRLDTGLIALRQRAIANVWAEPSSVELTSDDAGVPAAKTARQLMQELLPPATGDSI